MYAYGNNPSTLPYGFDFITLLLSKRQSAQQKTAKMMAAMVMNPSAGTTIVIMSDSVR